LINFAGYITKQVSDNMAGIYIHVPYCRKLCHYCDFHRSLHTGNIEAFLNAIAREIDLREDYLDNESIETIYFGGGTPSILKINELNFITEKIQQKFSVTDNAEITLEANPDDLDASYLNELKNNTVINRLSIGIQSFNDTELKLMNRRHNALQARQSVIEAKKAGFTNISIDLIYGMPGMTPGGWSKNLSSAMDLGVAHISAYHLTFEPGTMFYKYLHEGKLIPASEDESFRQYETLINMAHKNKFIHYEISNFAREGCFSRHNTNYWKQKKYMGLGPSAHSYNIVSRQWNVADNKKYIGSINKGITCARKELLDKKTRFNDYLLTSLRTMWGIDMEYIAGVFGPEYSDYLEAGIIKFLSAGAMTRNKSILTLTDKGKFISDYIISELIFA
jgi:oxygen-independent coproporphyrinogen-3 oxidase